MNFIKDSLLEKIKAEDNGDPLVDPRMFSNKIIIHHANLGNFKNSKSIKVRKGVAIRLRVAAQCLPKNHYFILYDGYREERIQELFFRNQCNMLQKQHPKWNKKKIITQATLYVANPSSVCNHLSGGAFDISLGKSGRQLAMGGFKLHKETKISSVAKKNRALLACILKKSGFINYPLEWWHWSYGDRYWAAQLKKKHALYEEFRRDGVPPYRKK
jgi:zinc D-Ala-D-Ala dipeptidase